MPIKKIFIISLLIGLLVPIFTHAQIIITEVMYDPLGSDTKREWIEVFNSGTDIVDLNTYFLFENNVHHKLTAQGSSIMSPGSYAIIADSIPEVLADYPEYTGLIFDSAFSLNNTGETIAISNSQKIIGDTFTYSADMGANNNGQSLQITNGQVITAGLTFGTLNKTESEIIIEEPKTPPSDSSGSLSSSGSHISSHSQQTSASTYTPTVFKIGAGRDRLTTINTPIELEGHISKSEVSARYTWSFGDFSTDSGRRTTHIYEYPGVYEVVLEAKSKDHTAISRTQIVVIEPQLTLSYSTSTVSITNTDSKEVNVGGFKIVYPSRTFTIPRNTIIKSKATVTTSRDLLETPQSILYPNGKLYYVSAPETI